MRNHLFFHCFLILVLTGCAAVPPIVIVAGAGAGAGGYATSESFRDTVDGTYLDTKRGIMRIFGKPGPCDSPFVLESIASVSLIILPYKSSVSNGGAISESAKKIPVLFQLANQFSPNIKQPHASIRLAGDDCDSEKILMKLLALEPGAETTVKEAHGVVILS